MAEFTHILDTHAWIWLRAGDERARPIAELPASSRLGISAISVWELGMLEAKGRIRTMPDIHTWVARALGGSGIDLVPLDPETAIASTRWSGKSPGDPADRIILATALCTASTLITADAPLRNYAKQQHVAVLAL